MAIRQNAPIKNCDVSPVASITSTKLATSGSLPAQWSVTTVTAADGLPVASSTYRGCIYLVKGLTGAPDVPYFCVKDDLDAYSWRPIGLGGD